ncbi:hypothetical protein CAL26_17010 [Bordetella genomosp. 9]|uniref:Uncharacterized protein n=1 Tax=Bordetella genomosp. 9 TaxID=1416803 RepID=A0A261R2R7_9BORD|nr:hypothetical protein [Bordetella genomosp. 9]OZI19334.1 hypothetical protein CAL26_17010 [Bordetella genomosp. 9]
MAIDGEPKDGDYVRYVEQLINRGQAAPGQVVAKARDALSGAATARGARSAPGMAPSPGEVVGKTRPTRQEAVKLDTQWGREPAAAPAGAPSAAVPPMPPAGAAQARNATLATRASTRRGAFAVTIVALAIAWQAVRMLFEALRRPGFDPHELVPVAFLAIFAGLLWRAARSQRKRAGQPLASLPPLTTISKNGPGNTGR